MDKVNITWYQEALFVQDERVVVRDMHSGKRYLPVHSISVKRFTVFGDSVGIYWTDALYADHEKEI